MRSARRTASSISGPGKDRGHASPRISATRTPMCSRRLPGPRHRSCPHHAVRRHRGHAGASRRDRPRRRAGAHALLILDKAGWHTTRKLNPPAISPLSRCRRHARNSTRPRTSGSICARPISPTVCSPTTPPFSTPARTPGENFSPRPVASPQSHNAIGSSSVNLFEGWYKDAPQPKTANAADPPQAIAVQGHRHRERSARYFAQLRPQGRNGWQVRFEARIQQLVENIPTWRYWWSAAHCPAGAP